MKNILKVMLSHGLTLLASILAGFIIPKVLGVAGYGYLKTYTLYASYGALLHLGFADGILLQFAGREYVRLDHRQIRTYTCFFAFFQLTVGMLVVLFSLLCLPRQYRLIGIMVGINLTLANMTTYYQFLSQATQRFTELSVRNVLAAVLKVAAVCLFYLAYRASHRTVSYEFYIGALNLIAALLLGWYIMTYRDITFGPRDPLRKRKRDIRQLFSKGIWLTLGYQTASLVLIVDRQFVSAFYNVETYAQYAFAYNVVTQLTALIGAASAVLFPTLKTMKRESAIRYFPSVMAITTVIAAGVLIGFFPIQVVVTCWLTNYAVAVEYLRIVMPTILLSGGITVGMFTFYKFTGSNPIYFRWGCIALVMGISANVFAQGLFGTPTAISWASVVTMLIWYGLCLGHLVQQYQVPWKKNVLFGVFSLVLFYGISSLPLAWWQGMIWDACGLMAVILIFYWKEVGRWMTLVL